MKIIINIFTLLLTTFTAILFAQPAISVHIPHKKIRIGQSTPVIVTGFGLNHLAGAGAQDYRLRISIDQPLVAAFDNASSLFIAPLDWARVSAQGTFTKKLSVTGLQTGVYSVTAELMAGAEEATFAPAAVQDVDCCKIEISWHTYQGSKLDSASKKYNDNLKNKVLDQLKKVEGNFKEEEICITFVEGKPIPPEKNKPYLILRSGGPKGKKWERPNLCDYANDANFASPTKPEIIIADYINVWGGKTWIKNDKVNGLTPYIGANVAAVKSDIGSLATYIQNELYHIFGLSDQEMGASLTNAKHTVKAEMWDFMRAVCKAGNGKNALIETRLERKKMKSGREDCEGEKQDDKK